MLDAMKKKYKKRKIGRNLLLIKTYFYFALMAIIMATVVSAIFLSTYQRTMRRQYRQQLEEYADKISSRFQEFIANEDYASCLSYLEILTEIGNYEIWSIANPYASEPMNRLMATMEFVDVNQENYTNLIYSAFLGKERFLTSYSEIHGCTMMSVGVPVIGNNGEICGALLINISMETQDEAIANGKEMIFYSVLVALVISVFVAFLFAGRLSKPVLLMRDTARMLARGAYDEKTGIRRRDEIGELARTIDSLADKLAKNEEMRNNLEQMRMDFFANVSHELRTPITVIRAYTETLVDGVVTDEEKVRQYYDRMLLECRRMERLVGDLLLLSKMQNPDFMVEKEPVNLMEIFAELKRSAGAIAAEKGIHICIEHEKEIYMMEGDYDRIRQMFLVIFGNAIKFSPENSTVHVTFSEFAEENKPYVRVSIRDEGVGISAEELPNIFEKFYKSKLRQNAKGTGLGLAIAKQIALKHGSEIKVRSEIGKGTEFIFEFAMLLPGAGDVLAAAKEK